MRFKAYRFPFAWRDISLYRGELFGAAILSVIFYHYFKLFYEIEASNKAIYIISRFYYNAIGSVGVDIFIFLSGFGLYYSLSRKPKLSSYYLKRVRRVVIPYLLCGLFYWTIRDFVFMHRTFLEFLLDYSLLSFWISEAISFWFISFITVLYIISPFVYWLANDRRRFAAGVVCSFGLILLCYFFARDIFENIEVALQRLPYFLIGMRVGKISKTTEHGDEQGTSIWLACVLVFSVFLKIIFGKTNFVLNGSFYGYYGIFLIFAYVLIRKKVQDRWKGLFSLLTLAGKYSLELYIAHTFVKNFMVWVGLPIQNPLIYLSHIVIMIPFVFCLVKILEILDNVGRAHTSVI